VQPTRARKNSIRVNVLLLSPTGLQSGRFYLDSKATAYLADSKHTTLYESIFRRDVHSRSFDELVRRSLVQFITKGRLRLGGFAGFCGALPRSSSPKKIAITQGFAQDCRTN
jgi:hypothetical protein